MLIDCPEGCGYRVSDQALACPRCGYPVREQLSRGVAPAVGVDPAAAERGRATRERIGEVDCKPCEARGFFKITFKDMDCNDDEGFEWCAPCECTGRVNLCQSSAGFYAVGNEQLEAFLAGEIDADEKVIFFLGATKPEGHKYAKAGKRFDVK